MPYWSYIAVRCKIKSFLSNDQMCIYMIFLLPLTLSSYKVSPVSCFDHIKHLFLSVFYSIGGKGRCEIELCRSNRFLLYSICQSFF